MSSPSAVQDASAPRPFEIDARMLEPGRAELDVRGRLSFAETPALWAELDEKAAALGDARECNLDISGLEAVDGGSMALLVNLRSRLAQRGVACEFVGASPEVQEVVSLYGGEQRVGRPRRRRPQGLLDQVGTSTLVVLG